MNRNILHDAIGFCCGNSLILFSSNTYSWEILLPGVLIVVLARYWKVLSPLLFLVLGAIWATIHSAAVLDQRLPSSLEGQDLMVTGTIIGLPQNRQRFIQFDFNIETSTAEGATLALPEKVRLKWYGRYKKVGAGERWQLKIRLKPPRGFHNPAGFDYERWLFGHRIGATGYVRSSDQNQNRGLSPKLGARLDQFRSSAQESVWVSRERLSMRGLVTALGMGVREGISTSQWNTLRETGTSHLVAISGLHVGLVAGLVYLLVSVLWGQSSHLILWQPTQRAAGIIGFAVALGYGAMAGFSLPTQRALVMLAVYLGSRIFYTTTRPGGALGVALFAGLIFDPLVLLSGGFWLSFVAVGAILLGHYSRVKYPHLEDGQNQPFKNDQIVTRLLKKCFNGIKSSLRVQFSVGIALIPVLVLFFGNFSLIAPVANLVAIPYIGFIVVPLVLLGDLFLVAGFTALSGELFDLGARALQLFWPLLEFLGTSKASSYSPPALPWWGVLSVAVGVGVWLIPRGIPGRWLSPLLLLPLLRAPTSTALDDGEFRVTFLDVGQGTAIVVATRSHTLLYDSGPRFSDRFDSGSDIIIPFLRAQGVASLDSVVISHGDSDHLGGYTGVVENISVAKTYTSSTTDLTAAEPCRAGTRWRWGGVDFTFLSPGTGSLLKGNNASCVLHIESPSGSLLLAGDIEREGEALVVSEYGDRLRSDLLYVPHHGSRTSSSALFLDQVQPQSAVISSGYNNRHGHPHPVVVDRYRQRDIELVNTADSGAITVHFREEGVELTRQRDAQRHIWHSDYGDK